MTTMRRPAFAYQATKTAITLAAGVEHDLIGSASAPLDIQDCDVFDFAIAETGGTNAIDTVKVYLAASGGGQLVAQSTTYTIGAGGLQSFKITGCMGMVLRVTGTSTSGATASCDYSGKMTGVAQPFDIFEGGVRQGQGTGGTITGNLAQSGGTVVINATGAVTIDASTSTTIGGASGTVVAGRTGQAVSLPGGATVGSTKGITGAGNMFVESGAGSTLTVGGASNAMVVGQAAKTATVNGDADFQGAIKAHAGDAGVAGTTGTVNAYVGTFTLASGSAAFTLTNSKITTTSLVWVQCISATPGQSIISAVPTLNTLTVTFGGNVTANAKCAFLVVNPGA